MKTILTLAAAAALSSLIGFSPARAAPAGPQSSVPTATVQDLLQPAYYPVYHHCRWWARECAYRWGWGSWRFRRCMRWHGC
jgi:hypothetical protein